MEEKENKDNIINIDGPSGLHFDAQKAGMSNENLLISKSQIKRTIDNAMKGSAYMQRIEEKKHSKDALIKEYKLKIENIKQNSKEYLEEKKAEFDIFISEIEKERRTDRYWIHVDLDMFYVACEIRDDPSLKNKPVAVGSSVISTSNYIARKYGVRSAMPTFVAKKLCPGLVVVNNNFPKYKAASDKFMEILREYDPDLESLGSDEGRLDVTDYLEENNIEKNEEELMNLMSEIRKRIYDKIRVTASSGCATNKMLAKLCSENNKPNGQFYLKRDRKTIIDFLDEMPIRKIPGIGAQSQYILNGLGVKTVRELREKLFELYLIFQETTFIALARRAYGISKVVHSEVQERKSISCSRTFKPTLIEEELLKHFDFLAGDVEARAKRNKKVGRGIMITIKTNTFKVKQKSMKLINYTNKKSIILKTAKELFNKYKLKENIRLLGIKLDDLKTEGESEEKNSLYNFFKKTEECVEKGKGEVIDIADEIKKGEEQVAIERYEQEEKEKNILKEVEEMLEENLDEFSKDAYSCHSINSNTAEIRKKKILRHKMKTDKKSTRRESPLSIKSASSVNSAKRRKEFIKGTVICPSCLNKIKTDGNITMFNRHLDKCLQEKEKSNNLGVEEIEDESFIDSKKEDNSVRSTKSVLSLGGRAVRTKKVGVNRHVGGKKMKKREEKKKTISITSFFGSVKKGSD